MIARTAWGALTLEAAYFTSEEIFQQEWERIFARQWLCIGRGSELAQPGSYVLADVGAENLIVTRDTAGAVHAFFNVCRHRGARVCSEPTGARTSLQCPYHAWTYDLHGRLIGAPTMQDVAGFDRADYPLIPVAAAEWEGFIFINLAQDAEPFEHVYAPLMGKFAAWKLPGLQAVRRIVYDVAANWKLIFQNYSECYHCPTLHPALNTLTPYQGASNDLEEGPFLGGPMQLAGAAGSSMTSHGRVCAPPLVSGEATQLVYYYTLFPTLFLSLHPDYVLTHRIEPLAPDRTRVVCDWYFDPQSAAAPAFDPAPAVEFWHMTNEQDWHVCELSQQGARSRGYRRGPYSELESMIAAFDRQYLSALQGR